MTNRTITAIDRTPPEWVAARAYVITNERELRRKYGGNFLAVTPEGVIDSDENRDELSRRMEIAHEIGSVYPLIARINDVIYPRLLELPERDFIIYKEDPR